MHDINMAGKKVKPEKIPTWKSLRGFRHGRGAARVWRKKERGAGMGAGREAGAPHQNHPSAFFPILFPSVFVSASSRSLFVSPPVFFMSFYCFPSLARRSCRLNLADDDLTLRSGVGDSQFLFIWRLTQLKTTAVSIHVWEEILSCPEKVFAPFVILYCILYKTSDLSRK